MSIYIVKTKSDIPKRVEATSVEFLPDGTVTFSARETPPQTTGADAAILFAHKVTQVSWRFVYVVGPGNLETIELEEETRLPYRPFIAWPMGWADPNVALPERGQWVLVKGGKNLLHDKIVARHMGKWLDCYDREISPVTLWRPLPED